MTLVKVNADGLECWSDGFRRASGGEVVFFSVFGPRNAVRAAWASVMQRGGYLTVGDAWVRRESTDSYVSMSAQLPNQWYHWALVHQSATNRASPFADAFYFLSPDPATDFFPRLNRTCPVPFRPSWSEKLWEAGRRVGELSERTEETGGVVRLLERGRRPAAITALSGHGLPGYAVSTKPELWQAIVAELIERGEVR